MISTRRRTQFGIRSRAFVLADKFSEISSATFRILQVQKTDAQLVREQLRTVWRICQTCSLKLTEIQGPKNNVSALYDSTWEEHAEAFGNEKSNNEKNNDSNNG